MMNNDILTAKSIDLAANENLLASDIPSEWSLLPNKHIFRIKKDVVGKSSKDYTLLSLTLKGVIQRNLDDGGKFPAEFDTYQKVEPGDFVFCLFDVEETPRCVGLSEHKGMITGAYTVLETSNSVNNKFLYYYYLNLDSDKRLRPLYTGLRNTISKEAFMAFKTALPPLPEQTAIANFLDDKTQKIDRAIAQKERLIELLKERKQIIIQDLVTGKKVWNEEKQAWTKPEKTKDSGVEWIGEIPEDWEVKRLKYVIKQLNRKADSKNETCNFIGMENIQPFTGRIVGTLSKLEGDASVFFKDNILFGKLRPYLSKVHHAQFDGICSSEFIVYQTTNSSFYSKLLQAYGFINSVNSTTYGTKMPRANPNQIGNMLIPIYSISIQNRITREIESEHDMFDKKIQVTEKQISLLLEYKASLIDSAVTGKIKVPH